jgi:S-adenosylmethionine:tRNA ribosyltransferase-isomerase
MLVSDFHFDLPIELIAQEPPAVRGASRMLALERGPGEWQDSWFERFPGMLRAGDVLVLNDSRVIPARLFGQRGAVRVEVLLTEQLDTWEWRVLTRPAKRIAIGNELLFSAPGGTPGLEATVVDEGEFGERCIRFRPVEDFYARLDALGQVPLPPYIRRPRQQTDQQLDRERYQTVYAQERGSVAAPTAGLHFTPEILQRIRDKGVQVEHVTLHVGLGTFQPVRVKSVAEIRLHAERYTLPASTADAISRAREENRRVVAAGTTTVRVLEHCASIGRLEAHSGSTSIFISPGYRFQVVGGLLTNFHLPESTLLMLVSAFAGKEQTLAAYQHAVSTGYRFFSYGDCMFIA